ncbi:MAG: DUF1499 domain-containing protein [Trueperaceae bacterium]|nr:DUF1499 domain-containing protein [Trueperaceae bacterium]
MARSFAPIGVLLALTAAIGGAGAQPVPTEAERAPLPPCPAFPNCVSTEAPATDATHHLPPLPLPEGLDPVAALDAFEALVRAAPRTDVGTRTPFRLRATDRSRVFRFVDDVEACVDPDARVLHARSAARLGQGDLGVNRRRLTGWFAALAADWGVAWPPRP